MAFPPRTPVDPNDRFDVAQQLLELAIDKIEAHKLGEVRLRLADVTITVVARGQKASGEND